MKIRNRKIEADYNICLTKKKLEDKDTQEEEGEEEKIMQFFLFLFFALQISIT